jgi:hypothetical protein
LADKPDKAGQLAEVFNYHAGGLGDWWRQKRLGQHEDRRAEIIARVKAMEGGSALLQAAEEAGVSIHVVPKENVGAEGVLDRDSKGNPVVGVANTGNPVGMAVTLWHELRHVLQNIDMPDLGVPYGRARDAGANHTFALMLEADAFTAEAVMAFQEKKKGNPEYYNHILKASGVGPYTSRRRFLLENPPESFRDEQQFARALFTEMMVEGLTAYSAKFFLSHGRVFNNSEDTAAFRDKIKDTPDIYAVTPTRMSQMYGQGFLPSTSMRALLTGFAEALPLQEQAALNLIEKTAANAASLTQQEFRRAREEVLQRVQDIYYTDPEDRPYETNEVTAAKTRLRKAARAEPNGP